MTPEFWHQLWSENRIGFHQEQGNPMFARHWRALNVAKGSRVFLPLCGKTGDIAWLLEQGYRVAGAELSATAIDQLFDGLGVTPTVTRYGTIEHRSADSLDLFVGDVFDLSAELLGDVDVVYDRAALIALPAPVRLRYAHHLHQITRAAPQILITLEYDQSAMSGPPFSVEASDIADVYEGLYVQKNLAHAPVEGDLKGRLAATERVWHLTARDANSG